MKSLITATGRRARTYARANPSIPQTVAAFAARLIGAALSFGFSWMIARHLGASGTGSFALALTTATVVSTVAILGLDYVLLRTVAGDLRVGDQAGARGTVRAVVAVVAVTAIVAAAAMAAIGAPLLARLLDRDLDPALIHLAAFGVLPLALNRVVAAALRGAGSIIMAQWLDGPLAMALAVSGFVALIAADSVGGVMGVLGLYIGTTSFSSVVAWTLYARRARAWPPARKIEVRPLLAQSWRISLIVLTAIVSDWLILLVIGARFSTAEVGQFRTASQITSLVALIVVTFDSVAGPRVAASHRIGDKAAIRQIWRQSVIIMGLFALPLFVVTLGFPSWVLGLFGPEFVPAATTLQILALGQLVNISTGPLGAVLIMTGRENRSLQAALAALVLLGVLGMVLIPAYGLVGAALSTSISVAFRKLYGYVVVRPSLRD